MRVLIIENETYLAQGIVNKLSDFQLECTIAANLKEIERKDYDVVIASLGSIDGNYQELTKRYEEAIIILMISYINDDTVTKPLQSGVTDYIVKPFVIDELVRKIRHYKSYRDLKKEIEFYCNYFNFIEKELSTPNPIAYNPPFIIKANSQRSADIYAMRYARRKGIRFAFLTLKEEKWRQIFESQPSKNQVFYITNLEELKKSELKEFLEMILKYSCIVSTISNEKVPFPQVVDISNCSGALELGGDILSVKEYERIIITKFESRYPDIELAKKLGMSRKSLWEKRKKYGLLRHNKTTKES
ncbi:response regulator [Helicobacter equorum]|uniref:response regulator n=1 Tax=Helicobacter equorum TaxID=361872 RepID=UPI000CF116B4|nr:response regulator [Helicobacter equorum]